MTRVSAALLAVVAAVAVGLSAAGGGGPGDAGATAPPTTIVDNPFLPPDDQNLSDCVSALPRPECGSEARGGWRQLLVFALVLVGFAFIAWRVLRSVRRRDARGVPPRRPPADRLDR